MGMPVIIYGKSGSGKSRSMKYFNDDEILLINVEKKLLPFKNGFRHVANISDPEAIKQAMYQAAQAGCRTFVLDDVGLIMTQMFMSGHRVKRGGSQFEMYDDIADAIYFLVDFVKECLPPDAIAYFLFHEDTNDYGETKIKTIGKLLDGKAQIAEKCLICIRCMSKDGRHFFRAVTDGSDITKAPEDMFPEGEFENDLKFVDTKIREFYGFINANIDNGGNQDEQAARV